MKKKSLIILYVLLTLGIPGVVIGVTNIFDKNEPTTLVFLILSAAIYLIGAVILLKLCSVVSEFNFVLKGYKQVSDKDSLSKEVKYKKLLSIIKESQSNTINKLFNEFSKTFKKVKTGTNESGEEIIKYYSTNDIEYYFDEDNLVSNNILSRTFTQITQALVAVGMFGTFLGIVKGVSKLSVAGDQMQAGIETLLKGVKTSFNSSLYGILFSVILTFALKIFSDIIMKKNRQFCMVVNDLIEPYTEQSALSDIENELKRQTSSFEFLSTNIVEQISKRFDESIQSNLENLSLNVETMIKNMQDNLAGSMNENMVNAIGSMASTMQPVMEKLESTITKIEKKQENTTDRIMEESISSIKDAISFGTSNEIARLKESMDVISAKNSELIETFSSSMDNMKELTRYQENLVKNTNDSTESMNVTTKNIQGLQDDLSRVIESLRDVNSTSTASLSGINDTLASMQDTMRKQVEISENLESMLNKSNSLGESQYKYINKFANLSEVMSGSIENTQKVMSELNSGINSYKNSFDSIKASTMEVAKTLDEKYKNITNGVSSANNELLNVVDSIKKNILEEVEATSGKLVEVTSKLNEFQTSSSRLVNKVERFAEVEESTKNLWSSYKDSFDSLNTNINEGIENYTQNVAEGMKVLFTEYDRNISEAVKSLNSMVDNLSGITEDIASMLEVLENKNIRKY